jgi:hypothetical protein
MTWGRKKRNVDELLLNKVLSVRTFEHKSAKSARIPKPDQCRIFRTGEKRERQSNTSTAFLVHSFTFSGRLYFRRPHLLFTDMEDWESAFPMAWQKLHLDPFATHSIPQNGVDIFRAGPLTTSGFGINPAEMRIATVEEIR